MSGLLTLFFSVWLGYALFLYFSHPNKKKHKVPKVRIGRLEFLPNLKLHLGSKTYHFHHWFVLALIAAIAIFVLEDFQFPMILQGLIIGGIIQGLRYPDRFKFRYPRFPELQKNIEQWQKDIKTDFEEFQKEVAKINKNINKHIHPEAKKKN